MEGSENPLELDGEAMRALGYRAVDHLIARMERLESGPVVTGANRAEIEELLREPPPEYPGDAVELLDWVTENVLTLSSQNDHPGFFGYIPSSPTWPAVVGDLMAHGWNTFAGMWSVSAGLTGVELVVIDWFKQWIGYPEDAGGLLVSGGSSANLTALACAREAKLDGELGDAVAYASTQVHSSIGRALRILGFSAEQLRAVEADEAGRMSIPALEAAVEADRRAGLRPFVAVGSAGTTNNGAVDELPALAALCRERGLWLHVDAAYGGFAVLSERGRRALVGLSHADSITLDPHKWLFQPYAAGCVLVRDDTELIRAFSFEADYHQDTLANAEEINYAYRGIELTRPARALKIWLSLKTFGVADFREAIDRALDLAKLAEQKIREAENLELLSPASLGIVCFRRRCEGSDEEADELNARLLDELNQSGDAFVSSTRLNSHYAIRICVLNFRSQAADVQRVLAWFNQARN